MRFDVKQRNVNPLVFSGEFEFTAEDLDTIFDVEADEPELNRLFAQIMVADRWNRLTRSQQAALVVQLFQIGEQRAAEAKNLNTTLDSRAIEGDS